MSTEAWVLLIGAAWLVAFSVIGVLVLTGNVKREGVEEEYARVAETPDEDPRRSR